MSDQFSVIHQSDDATIHAGEVVQLFCLASKHCSAYQYNWDNLQGAVGLLSPVLYANKEGIYRCTVTMNATADAKCYSRSITISQGVMEIIITLCMVLIF